MHKVTSTNRHREAAERPWRSIFLKRLVSMDCHGLASQALAMTVTWAMTIVLLISNAVSASTEAPLKQIKWPFDGIFGYFDTRAAQRGFQVYKEVCQTCHSLNYVSYRNLQDIGFTSEEVKAIASQYQVQDGPNDKGEMYMRPAAPYDKFVSTYPNENAARASNNGAYPPDLSLIVKARLDGANYLYSILTGYDSSVPSSVQLGTGMYYNSAFPGHQIAMPPPLVDGLVTYEDGTQATLDQMAKDVVVFLQWTAEPEMAKRKLIGIKVISYLLVFTVMFYIAKRRIWKSVK